MSAESSSPAPPQTHVYAASLLLSFLMEAIWPALTPLMGIMQVLCLIGIFIAGPLELYQLCRKKTG